MYELIKKKPVYFPDPVRHKIVMSDECKDFITKLLEKEPSNRIGSANGIDEICAHPWLASIDISDLLNKKIEAPFKPKLSDNLCDVSNFDAQFTSEEAVNSIVPAQKMDQIRK